MKRIVVYLLFVVAFLSVSCQKAPELALSSPTSIDVSANGGTSTITFITNGDWTVSSSELWVTVSPSSGSVSDDGTATVKVNCTANTTYEPRSATVTITVEDLTQTVTVNQPANLEMIVPNKLFEITGKSTIVVEVQSNVHYTVSISEKWISYSGTKALVTDKLVFNADDNDTYDPRSAIITIKPLEGNLTEQVVTVKQAQKDAILIGDTSYTMPYGGGEIQFNVQSNVQFDVKPNVEWIHYVGTKALSNSTVRLVVDANGTYNAREGKILVSQRNGSITYEIIVKQAGRLVAVDLGLPSGLKWATYNLGASSPEEYGDYYAWGELETKYDYSWSTYKWCNGSSTTLTKYNTESSYGTVDNKTTLDASDDVAHVKLGDKWRIPTDAEWTELRTKCTWTWTTQNGVYGRKVTGPNGKSIFLPAAGCRNGTSPNDAGSLGRYWSSSLDTGHPDDAWNVYFNSEEVSRYVYGGRYRGFSVRPVYGDVVSVTSVSLNLTSLSLYIGETKTLVATVKPDNAVDKSVTWSSNNTSVATVSSSGVVTAKKIGSATITVKTNDGGKTASCTVTVKKKTVDGAVDLGLSVLWATCNVGASSPEKYGNYYCWGELNTKSNYVWSTYRFRLSGDNDENIKFTKYVTTSDRGTVDNRWTLDLEDDVAWYRLGGGWRTPSFSEYEELVNNCNIQWTTYNGVYGMRFTSRVPGYTDQWIFIPAAGCKVGTSVIDEGIGEYQSATLYSDPYAFKMFRFNASGTYLNWYGYRRAGFPVRPVYGTGNTVAVSSVSLNTTSLSLMVGETQTLTATVSPSNATDKSVNWSSSNTSVATVSSTGVVTAKKSGNATITVKTNNGGKTATCSVTVKAASGQQAVDLGLPSGLKWGTCNIGASTPEEYGNYYAWGETETKSNYNWATYKWCKGTYNSLTKYNTLTSYGTVDNKTKLENSDDVAHVKLGGKWRMPTDAEWTELRTKCSWTWTTQNGVKGRKVTGPNGNSIFLPAAGYRAGTSLYDAGSGFYGYYYGYYWSSSLNTDYPDSAWDVGFNTGNSGEAYRVYRYNRYNGSSVRPVSE